MWQKAAKRNDTKGELEERTRLIFTCQGILSLLFELLCYASFLCFKEILSHTQRADALYGRDGMSYSLSRFCMSTVILIKSDYPFYGSMAIKLTLLDGCTMWHHTKTFIMLHNMTSYKNIILIAASQQPGYNNNNSEKCSHAVKLCSGNCIHLFR